MSESDKKALWDKLSQLNEFGMMLEMLDDELDDLAITECGDELADIFKGNNYVERS